MFCKTHFSNFQYIYFFFILKCNRGYDPTFCVLDECAYMNPSAVSSAMTYGTNRGVTILLLCSPVSADHWLSKLDQVRQGANDGICLIKLQYLCNCCAEKGITGVCVHGRLMMPPHIDTGDDLINDPIRQTMELISPGAFLTEICGYNSHTIIRDTLVFSRDSLIHLTTQNNIILTEREQNDTQEIFICVDPVQAGSGTSGIGLAIVLRLEDSYVVSIRSLACIKHLDLKLS